MNTSTMRLRRSHHVSRGSTGEALGRTKSYVGQVTLPPDGELPPALADFFELSGRPAQQAQHAQLEALGLGVDGDFERRLGRRVVEALDEA